LLYARKFRTKVSGIVMQGILHRGLSRHSIHVIASTLAILLLFSATSGAVRADDWSECISGQQRYNNYVEDYESNTLSRDHSNEEYERWGARGIALCNAIANSIEDANPNDIDVLERMHLNSVIFSQHALMGGCCSVPGNYSGQAG